jgi:hypothetical protein
MLHRVDGAVAEAGNRSTLAQVIGACSSTLAQRVAVVLTAPLIVYWRTPTTFVVHTAPAFNFSQMLNLGVARAQCRNPLARSWLWPTMERTAKLRSSMCTEL